MLVTYKSDSGQPSALHPTVLSLHSIYLGGVMYEISLQPSGPSLHSIYLGGVMYEISLQTCSQQVPHYTVFTLVVSCMRSACSPQVPHYTVFTLVVSCMRSAFRPAAHRSLTTQYLPWWCYVWDQPSALRSPTTQYLPWWCHVWDQPSALQPTGPSLHSIYLGGVMYEISLQTCSPHVSHCIAFTLVVSCMRSAFRPAAHRSLTTQYLPWWCHVWDQPSALQPTGPSLYSIYLGGVMYEISLQTCSPQVSHYIVFTLVVSCMRSAFRPAAHRSFIIQYLPWWCHVWDQPSDLQPAGPALHSIYLGGVMYEISLQTCSSQVPH